MTDNPFDPAYVEPEAETVERPAKRDHCVRCDEPVAFCVCVEVKPAPSGHVRIFTEFDQGSEAWMKARCGLLTASEMKLIINPPPKIETRIKKNGEPYKQREQTPAENDACRVHLYELLAQRITGYVEPHFQSYDMERGNFDEEHARSKYSEIYGEVQEVGFITNDRLGFPIGYSPDGLVGDDGQIEAKSRAQKWQMQTLVEYVAKQEIPPDFLIQVQTGLFVTERQWLDFISYSGGMKMAVVRCYPDPVIHEAIGNAAIDFERRLNEKREIYEELIASDARLVDTERLIYL